MRQYGSFFRKVLDKPSEKDLFLYRHKSRGLENFWFCNDFSHNIYYFFTLVKIFSLHPIRSFNFALMQHLANSAIIISEFLINLLFRNKPFRSSIMQSHFICQIFSFGNNR